MAKSFAWSYSKLKNFETCPFRYKNIDVDKKFQEAVTEGSPLQFGNRVHDALAGALKKTAPLPADLVDLQRWVDSVNDWPGQLYVEQKYAITRTLAGTDWFGFMAWYRGIGDAVKVHRTMGLIVDWKTGKVPEIPDSPQLTLMAQCVFSHFPEVQTVRSEFVWLKENTTTSQIYTRKGMADEWPDILGRVKKLEDAHKADAFPKTPSGLCKRYCVVTACEFHGKGSQ